MNTASPLETLKAIGAEGISLQTHISQSNIKKLLSGEFDSFTAIQFNGFLTILEREYDLDLGEWRMRYEQMFPNVEAPLADTENDPFLNAVRAKKQQRLTVAVLTGLLLLVLIVTYFVLGSGGKQQKIELNNTAIEKAKANMATMSTRVTAEVQGEPVEENASTVLQVEDTNLTEENNTVPAVEEVPAPMAETPAPATEIPEPAHAPSADIVITPETTIWLGIINEQTHKRKSTVTDEPLILDGATNWLIITGHGYLSLEYGDGNETFKKVGRMLFVCEEGTCRQIDEEEFKALNQGIVW